MAPLESSSPSCTPAPSRPSGRFELRRRLCDFGAMTCTDPHNSIPEVARVLRPGPVRLLGAPPIVELALVLGELSRREPDGRLLEGIRACRGPATDPTSTSPTRVDARVFVSTASRARDLIELLPAADCREQLSDRRNRAWARPVADGADLARGCRPRDGHRPAVRAVEVTDSFMGSHPPLESMVNDSDRFSNMYQHRLPC